MAPAASWAMLPAQQDSYGETLGTGRRRPVTMDVPAGYLNSLKADGCRRFTGAVLMAEKAWGEVPRMIQLGIYDTEPSLSTA